MWYYLKNDKGNKSLSATLVMVSFAFTLLANVASFILNALELPTENMAPITAAMLIPVLTLYWGRRHTDSKAQQ